MEANVIDAVHVLLLPVALEGEGFFAGDLLEVVDADPPLDAADGEPRHVGEGGDAARLEFERTFLPRMLPRRARHVVGNDVPPGRGHDHEVLPNVEGVAPLRQLEGHGGGGAAAVPEFELLVPPPADDHVAGGEEADAPDRGVVGADLLRHSVGRLLAELPHPDGLVGTAGDDGVAVGREGRAEGRGLTLVVDLRLGQRAALAALLLGLPTADAAVPVGTNEDVGGWTPREAGDAVGPGALDVVIGRGRHGVGAGCRGGGSEGGHCCVGVWFWVDTRLV
mmetsp:Transcript_23606/g.67961  ORF Transcript_23606/g.67961 Transcript_23606/m.67961 type:complete len:279 (+) Transcript_23606:475-1311(+)